MKEVPKTHIAVDRDSYEEIKGAVEIDEDAHIAKVRVHSYTGEYFENRHFPGGICLVRRH